MLYRVLNKTSRQSKTVILSGASASQSEADAQSKDPYLPHKTQPTQNSPAQGQICHFEGAGANATASRETCFSSTSSQNLRQWQPGDAFKLFMAAYMSFRLLCDFIKPYPRLFLGLGGIQWACVLILLYYSRDIARWLRGSLQSQPT